MILEDLDRLGIGTYSPREAARLVGIGVGDVRRWRRTDERVAGNRARRRSPDRGARSSRSSASLELDFRELMELRAVAAFRELDVSRRIVVRAHERAVELVGHPFPFSTSDFSTDGERIFAEAAAQSNPAAPPADVISGQAYFTFTHRLRVDLRRIATQLNRDVEFGADGLPLRWSPLGRARSVLVDPGRGFGQPIVRREGVPTRVLWDAYVAERNSAAVARWFGVSAASMRDALAWERRRAS